MTTRGSNFAGVGINDADFVSVVSASTSDTYNFYRGGTSGTFIASVKLMYSDTAKTTMVQVIKL